MRADDGKFKMTYADAAKSKEKRQADKAAREKQWQGEVTAAPARTELTEIAQQTRLTS